MKCKKLFLVSIFLLAVLSLGVVCAEDNQTLDDSIALNYAQDDMDNDFELLGENQKENIENLADLNQKTVRESSANLPVIDIPDEIIYYSGYEKEITITFPEITNGSVVVLLDGEYYTTAYLDEYVGSCAIEHDDGTITVDYSINIPLNIEDLTYKSYNVTVIYNADNIDHEISQSKICKLSYIGLTSDFFIYNQSLIEFSVPPDINSSNFIIIIDGKRYEADLNEFYSDLCFTGNEIADLYLPIGFHSISIKYPGDDIYPELEYDAVIDVEKDPYCEFPLGQNATIFYIHTPQWGEKFLVSIELDNEDNTTSILTEYVSLVDGKASCTVSGLDLGKYVAKVYNADSNELVFNDYFSVVPLKINVPEKIHIEKPGSVSAVLPADAIGNMSVKIFYMDDDDNLKQYLEVTVPFKNGVAVVDLPKLFATYYMILDVCFTTENYGNYNRDYSYYFEDFIDDDGSENHNIDDGGYGDVNNRIIKKHHSNNNILKSTNNGNNNANIISYLKTELQSSVNEANLDTTNNTSKKAKNTTISNKDSSKVINDNVVEANQNTIIIAVCLLVCGALAFLLVRKFKS